jgi:hypothetical protein
MKSFITHLLAFLAGLWTGSTYVRHAVITFLTVEVVPILSQIYDWSTGAGPLPNFLDLASNAWKAVIAGLIAALIRWIQMWFERTASKDVPTNQ